MWERKRQQQQQKSIAHIAAPNYFRDNFFFTANAMKNEIHTRTPM